MNTSTTRSSGRLRAVRVLAGVMAVSGLAFGLFTIVLGIVSPAQAPHAFHNIVVAALLIVLSAPAVVAIALAPENAVRPLVILSTVVIAGLVTMAVALTPDPFTLPFVILVGVLWALVPDRTGALRTGRPSPTLLLLVLASAIPLLAYALDQAGLQRVDRTSEHAAFYHWVETSFYAVAIVLLGLLAAIRPVAYRLAAWSAAVGALLLGVGSILFPTYASALPGPWGWVALVGGVAFLGISEIEVRRARSS